MLVLLLLASCESPPCKDYGFAIKPGQSEAEALVLRSLEQSSGLTKISPEAWCHPGVQWIEQPELDCGGGTGWTRFFARSKDGTCSVNSTPVEQSPLGKPACQQCVIGLSLLDLGYLQAAWSAKTAKFSQTSLAHEEAHFFLYYWAGDADYFHAGPAYKPGGWVEQANKILRDAGY